MYDHQFSTMVYGGVKIFTTTNLTGSGSEKPSIFMTSQFLKRDLEHFSMHDCVQKILGKVTTANTSVLT